MIRTARGDALTAPELDAILVLRTAVFVVEQECAYQEVDGRDALPTTWHAWIGSGSAVDACLRVLTEPDGTRRIGRVCTAASARGKGLAAQLMAAAVAEIGDTTSVLDAQTYASGFYARFGYEPEGDPFDEDGIEHIRMTRIMEP